LGEVCAGGLVRPTTFEVLIRWYTVVHQGLYSKAFPATAAVAVLA
jgi:hypothetical protein